jgi:glutamate racemase
VASDSAIGVFDSGVGGLSVLREIRRELPFENLLYVADSGYAPYGDRPAAFVQQRARSVVEFLIGQGATSIVVACNTATAVAVDSLRSTFTLPIVAIEPAVKPAAATTRSGVVGVLATTNTLTSAKFATLVEQYAGGASVLTHAAPGLVEQVESGDLTSERTRALIERYVDPLLEEGADTLVLGCTHFPFLTPLIQEIAGPNVAVIDPATAVARELRRRLTSAGLLSASTTPGSERFWTSGPIDTIKPLVSRLWSADVDVRALPENASEPRETRRGP